MIHTWSPTNQLSSFRGLSSVFRLLSLVFCLLSFSTPHKRVITITLTPGRRGDPHFHIFTFSIRVAQHIHSSQIFRGLRREPHLFPCSSIHWTTVFCIGFLCCFSFFLSHAYTVGQYPRENNGCNKILYKPLLLPTSWIFLDLGG